jgi:hypothetical protein
VVGDPTWSDYTMTLKARKLSGSEGFLVFFGLPTDDARSQWNLGADATLNAGGTTDTNAAGAATGTGNATDAAAGNTAGTTGTGNTTGM